MGAIKNAYKKQADINADASQQLVNDLAAASQDYQQQMEQLDEQERKDAEVSAATERFRQAQAAGVRSLADMYVNTQKQAEQEAAEVKAKEEAERKAAKWTGATNLAASLVNLFGVGAMHSANQTYKDPSQDWMRQADATRKAGKIRLDQLADRQRALDMQIRNMKIGEAKQALDEERANARLRRKQGEAAAQQEYKDKVAEAKIVYESANKTAALESKAELAEIIHSNKLGGGSSSTSGGKGSYDPVPYRDEDGNIYEAKLPKGEYKHLENLVLANALNDEAWLEKYKEEKDKTQKQAMLLERASRDKEALAILNKYRGDIVHKYKPGENIVKQAFSTAEEIKKRASGAYSANSDNALDQEAAEALDEQAFDEWING